MEKLLISTTITKEFLDRMESDMASAMREHLVARNRWLRAHITRSLFSLMRVISIVGLLLSALLLYLGQPSFLTMSDTHFRQAHFGVMVFFVLVFLLSFFADHAMKRNFAFSYSMLDWGARKRARDMLKVAKKSAPFIAEYDFRGDSVVYRRNNEEQSTFVWHRQMKGVRLSGNGYTLIFRKERAFYPYIIILHDASDALQAYLNASGVGKLNV